MINTNYGFTSSYNSFYNSMVWKSLPISSVSSVASQQTGSSAYSGVASNGSSTAASSKVTTATIQKQISSYLSTLNSNANSLKSAAKPFLPQSDSRSFEQKSVSSDSLGISGSADDGAANGTFLVNVSQLAQSQVNSGSKLNSAAATGFSAGSNTISIKVGSNAAKTVSFNIKSSDTNKTGLEKMAAAINNAKTGVTASVSSDEKAGTSYLKLTSDNTGTGSTFSVSDKYGGNVAALSGAATTTTAAQNANYTVNGMKYTSQKNEAAIDNGKVTLTLKQAENKNVKVSVGSDVSAIQSDIKNFVSQYNKMVNFTADNADGFAGAATLNDDLQAIVNSRRSSLSAEGISVASDGTLTVDDTKLTRALSTNLNGVKATLSSVGDKVYSKSSDVLSSPNKYSQPDIFTQSQQQQNSGFYSYLSPTGGLFASNYMYSGMLFDNYY